MRKHIVSFTSYTEVVNGRDIFFDKIFMFDTKEAAETFVANTPLINSGLTNETCRYIGVQEVEDPKTQEEFSELGPDDLIDEPLPL